MNRLTIDEIIKRQTELETDLSSTEVLSNRDKLISCTEEYNKIKAIRELLENIETTKKDIFSYKNMYEEAENDETREMIQEQIKILESAMLEIENRLIILQKPTDPDDKKNSIIEIRAGTGGEEAALFAAQLLRMYCRFAETKGWSVELMHTNETDNGGMKEAIIGISGKNVYGIMKYESGVHRVQRIPVTESSGRIHTSAASVVVLPEINEVEVNIDPKDIRIDVFRATGAGGQCVNRTDSAVRITHIPSGTVVSCQESKSQLKNREKAMSVLRSRLYNQKLQEQNDSVDSKRKAAIQTGDRSAKIRTYNFPQSRVTDHRIKQSWFNIEAIMNGEIQDIINSVQAIISQ